MGRIRGIVNQLQFIDMASHLKTLQLVLFMLLSSYIIFIRGQKIGITWNGLLNGTTLTTRKGRNIEAFLGIPYAKPPIGPLRFRSPVEANSWRDVRDATTDGDQCTQFLDGGEIGGKEDCLYLNVYTPRLLSNDQQTLFPTLVYFHGDDFVKGNGSSTTFGPQYLLDKDVVLVTMNYRLGVLGFFSTGDSEAPGNFGLKDQVLALKWVQKNIVFFGGDREQVTLFGQGAGSVSAQLHSVSDSSDGLFKQYISQSGTSSCFWAFTENKKYTEYSKELGKKLKCPTTNSRLLIDCLRTVDSYNLVNSSDIFGNAFYRFNTWVPTNEPESNGAFLTDYRFHKIVKGKGKNYTAIIGHVADEGLVLTAQLYSNDAMYEKVVNNLDAYILDIIKVAFDTLTPEKYAARVKDFYFNDTEPSQKETFLKNMTNFISDVNFLISGSYIEQLIINWQGYNVYMYSFDYRGTFSKTSRVTGSNENIGITNGDDLMYLFSTSPKKIDQQRRQLSESDEQMIDTMVDLWTSFAYYGTPSTKRFSNPNFWQPYKTSKEYLIIGNNSSTSLSRQDHFREDRDNFWMTQIGDQVFGGFSRAAQNN